MKSNRYKKPSILLSTLLSAAMISVTTNAQTPAYVTQNGDFCPDGFQRPHAFIESAICDAAGNAVTVGQGEYFAPLRFDQEGVRLVGVTGQTARITPLPANYLGSLRVMTYNTHLFGGAASSLASLFGDPIHFKDSNRAAAMIPEINAEQADIAVLQEVWDPSLANTLAVGTTAGGLYNYYGSDIEQEQISDISGIPELNSGLLTLSRHLLAAKYQEIYLAEKNFPEVLSSKGFTRVTLEKDGFLITVFNTHLQADNEPAVRFNQVAQLRNAVVSWRNARPNDVIIIAGDFNIGYDTSVTSEYINTLRHWFNPIGGRESGPTWYCGPESFDCTTCGDNDLRGYFYPGSGSSNSRIDFILTFDSLSGTNRIQPVKIRTERFLAPSAICDGDDCFWALSDHEAVIGDFTLLYVP